MVMARSIFVVFTQQIFCDYAISCVAEKTIQIKTISSFSAIEPCFDVKMLNSKTIILLNLAQYRSILANSAYGLVGCVLIMRRYSARFRGIIINYRK